MAERLYDVDVEIHIPGNELPEFLTTQLQVIAFAGDASFP
jgi:hypothetical protein